MKRLQIALLVAAGAVTGVVVMKVWESPEPALQPAGAPPPLAQVKKPNPAAPPMVQPQAASSEAGQPKSESVSALAPPTHIVVRPPVRPPETSVPGTAQDSPTPPPPPPARKESENVTPAPPPPPDHHRATLNAGMLIPVRLVDGLSTERNKPGDRFTATLVNELIADDFVIAERGARVEGRVVASDPGKTSGVAGLTVELTRLDTSDGQSVAIRTESFERRASGGARPILPVRGMPATLPSKIRIPFRLGASVTLTERVH